MKRKQYIIPFCRAVNIGGEDAIAEPTLGEGSKFEDGPILVREQDDDLWEDETKQITPSSSNVWDNAW